MISFLRNKLWKNKWLTLCLLFGNILLVGIVTATPLFTTATMQRIFQEDMRNVQYSRNTFPAVMRLEYILNYQNEETRIPMYYYARDAMWPRTVAQMEVPPVMSVRAYTMSRLHFSPYVARSNTPRTRNTTLLGVEGFENNIELIHGRMPSDQLVDGHIIEVLASEFAMNSHDLIMNELLITTTYGEREAPLKMKVVGIYEIAEESEAFWSALLFFNPVTLLLTSDRLLYNDFMQNYSTSYWISAHWIEVLDFTEMHVRQVPHYQQTIHNITEQFQTIGWRQWNFNVNFYTTMQLYVSRTQQLALTLWVLQIPMYVMMALYIYMVSRQILLLDKNDVAILHSRGASRKQIMGLYVLQGLFVGVVSFPLGLGLGILMCRVMGASNGFLEMVQRASLDITITWQAIFYGLIAAAFSFLTMLLPVRSFSKITIVDHKRKKAKKPLWQRFFLDVVCFGVAILGLYNFNVQQEYMANTLSETPFVDPLLFINSSFFILGAGLIGVRVFPYLVKLVFVIGRRFFSPSVYASMLKVMRSAGEEQFIMLFLIFTVAIGTFSAQVARTINLNNDHRIQYMGGADLIFREYWGDNWRDPPPAPPEYIVYSEPDFHRFLHFDEVESITQVARRRVNLRAGDSTVNNMHMMAIDTRSFGETAWFRQDLLPIDINYFLNILAVRPDGVLLSDNFRTQFGYSIGDMITLTERPRWGLPSSGRFVVVGFVEYWPGFNPIVRTRLPTGEITLIESSLAVVNLGHLFTTWGARPYQVWMTTNTGSTEFFRNFMNENRIIIEEFGDTTSALVAIRSDPVVQGTNGMLTMSFVITLLVCFTGFLIYWILSIKSRILQFGIFRAMGLSMRNIIALLINEQIFITLTALAIGGVVGVVSARFFVPLIQMSYSTLDQVLPLIIVMEGRDYRNLYGVLGIMVALCLLILTSFISRINITQALKLGED